MGVGVSLAERVFFKLLLVASLVLLCPSSVFCG